MESDLAVQRSTILVSQTLQMEWNVLYKRTFNNIIITIIIIKEHLFAVRSYFSHKEYFPFHLSAVEAFEEVSDSLCVPQYNADGEERVILFLKMAPGKTFSLDLVAKIKGAIRKALSARHVPAVMLEIRDIPVRKLNINQIVYE